MKQFLLALSFFWLLSGCTSSQQLSALSACQQLETIRDRSAAGVNSRPVMAGAEWSGSAGAAESTVDLDELIELEKRCEKERSDESDKEDG